MKYEAVIGLEVHAQLATKTKLFCGCAQAFGAPANAQTCEVCLGMPGTLPALNGEAALLWDRDQTEFKQKVLARHLEPADLDDNSV